MTCVFCLLILSVLLEVCKVLFQRVGILMYWFYLSFSCFNFIDFCFLLVSWFFSLALLPFYYQFLEIGTWIIDLKPFLFSNIIPYCYKFPSQHIHFTMLFYIFWYVVFVLLFSCVFLKFFFKASSLTYGLFRSG